MTKNVKKECKNERKKRRKLNTSEKEAYALSSCNNHKEDKIIIFNDASYMLRNVCIIMIKAMLPS